MAHLYSFSSSVRSPTSGRIRESDDRLHRIIELVPYNLLLATMASFIFTLISL